MKKYYTSGVYLTSIICGVAVYLVSSLFCEALWALLFGVGVTLIVSFVIPLSFVISDFKYKPLKIGIPAPFIIDERVNCVIGGVLRHGFMVLTKESIFLITFADKKPVRYEIKRKEVKKISLEEDVYLNIFLDYDKYIRIASGNCLEISEKLSEQGFGI